MANSDWFYSSFEFQDFFKGATRSLVIKADAPAFTVLAASDNYLSLTHKQRHDIVGKGLFVTYPGAHSDPNEKDSVFSSFVRVMNSKERDELPVFKYEISIGENGTKESHYWTNVNEPILDAYGNVVYLINTTTNITRQIRQQNALMESENRFRLMAEDTDVMIAVVDEGGGVVYYNRAWELATGVDAAKLLEVGWVSLIHPEDKPEIMDKLKTAFNERKAWLFEFRMRTSEGRDQWFMARGTPRFTADGTFAGYISSSVDITKQKEQQADLLISKSKLEESEHLLKLAIESARIGIWLVDINTGKLDLSDRGREIMGIKPSVELTIEDSYALIDPSDRDNVADSIHAAVAHTGSFITEYKVNTAQNGALKWLRASGTVQKDHAHTPVRMIGTILDITEDKLNEERKNDFISMVSHELKTPLTSINAYVQVLENRTGKNEDAVAGMLLGKTNKQVAKMTKLINGFLNVSRLESAKIHMEWTKFDMVALFAEVKEDVLASFHSHQIIFEPVQEARVLADWDKIGQVINNLVSNAVKYASGGTRINVSCVTKGNWVRVSVSDEGVGISPENLPKLFERYYRVEGAVQGISGFGIGLYLCYEIISLHKGRIWAESKLGVGSTFHFTLPLLIEAKN
jgi:two-component system sensor histidine kinase VicK